MGSRSPRNRRTYMIETVPNDVDGSSDEAEGSKNDVHGLSASEHPLRRRARAMVESEAPRLARLAWRSHWLPVPPQPPASRQGSRMEST